MRIISKFKDYYDSSMGYGVDPNIVYLRNTTDPSKEQIKIFEPIVKIYKSIPDELKLPSDPITSLYIKQIILIGFCGKLYPAFQIGDNVFYTTQKFVKYIKPIISSKNMEKIEEILNKEIWGYLYNHKITHKSWENTVNEMTNKTFDEIFIKLEVPIFVIKSFGRDITYELNPNLRLLNFQTVKPPTEAFQEIFMYVGNQLAKQQDPVPINVPDKFLSQKKGFDEWSFRKKGKNS